MKLALHPDLTVHLTEHEIHVGHVFREVIYTSGDVSMLLAALRAFVSAIDGERNPELETIVADLHAAEVLVETDNAETSPSTFLHHLREIVRLSHRIAGDIAAFGDEASLCARIGNELRETHLQLASVATMLGEQRASYLKAQLQRLPTSDIKLNLGSGTLQLQDWTNVDAGPADLRMDLRWGLPLPDGSVRLAMVSHFLEHLSLAEARALLRDVHRVLRVGGTVRIIVPNFRRYAEAYVSGESGFFETQARHWTWANEHKTYLHKILGYAAGADAPADVFMTAHRYGYDFETMKYELERAGFARIEQSDFMKSPIAELNVDDQMAYAAVHFEGRSYSLFVEATK